MAHADDSPIHYYDIDPEPGLNTHIQVTIEDNHGDLLYKRINVKDTVKQLKVKLSSTCASQPPWKQPARDVAEGAFSGWGSFAKHPNPEDMRLYVVKLDGSFIEMQDSLKVKEYGLSNNAKLFLLTYRWTAPNSVVVCNELNNVTLTLAGIEPEDSVLGVKVRAQDQLGVPVKNIEVNISRSGQKPMKGEMDYIKISSVTEQYPVTIVLTRKI